MALLGTLLIGLSYLVSSAYSVPGDCSFDIGLCSYTQDTQDRFDWTQQNGSTPSWHTGPSKDHTTGSGKYMFIETSSPRLNKESAVLISPAIPDTTGNCVAFYYHMKGYNVRTLNVYTQEAGGTRKLRWTLSGDQHSTDWSFATFALPSHRSGLKIVFEGYSGTSYMGDIAIDDIKVYDSPTCGVLPSNAVPTSNNINCGAKPQNTRIVGGTEAAPGAWPWQAMLMYLSSSGAWRQFCGGTLVSPEWVVTASHCVDTLAPSDYNEYNIRLGAHYRNQTTGVEQDFEIERVYVHPDYNAYPYQTDNDIALIKLKKPAILNQRVSTACLPDSTVQFPVGTRCSITGWGTLMSGGDQPWKLQEAQVLLTSTAECTKNGSYPVNMISPMMQCASAPGIDTCQGDSGGPLVCENDSEWYLLGVTSWGYSCANPNYPGVYARVTGLRQWVDTTMANHV